MFLVFGHGVGIGFFNHFFRRVVVLLGYFQFGSEIEVVDVVFVVDGFALPLALFDVAHGYGLSCLEDVRTDSPGV